MPRASPSWPSPAPAADAASIEGYRFPLRGLSADEAEALLLLGVPDAVAELGLADALAAAHRKVSTSAGCRTGGAPAAFPSSTLTCPAGSTAPKPVPHLRTLAEAVRLGRGCCSATAGTTAARRQTREVGPLGLVNKAGTWYLVAIRPATAHQVTAGRRPGGLPGRTGHVSSPADR